MPSRASLGPGLLITAFNVKYRDFRFIIPFILQFGLYASPVGFSSAVVPEAWRFWYSLNPVVGVIDGFRWCLLGGESQLYMPGFLMSIGVAAMFLWVGVVHFRRTERRFRGSALKVAQDVVIHAEVLGKKYVIGRSRGSATRLCAM